MIDESSSARSPVVGMVSRLLTNGAWNALSALVAGVLAFLLVPLLLRRLGEEVYGIWVLIGSLFAYSTVLHFGISSAINRYLPLYLARNDIEGIRRVVSTGTVFFSGVGAVIAILTLLLRSGITQWFQVAPSLATASRRAVLVVGLLSALTVVSQSFGAALSGYQRYDLMAVSRLLMLLLRGGALWMLLQQSSNLVAVAWVFGLTELGVNLLQYLMARRVLPRSVVRLSAFDRRLMYEMLGYGGNTFLYSVGAVVAYKASEVIIATMRPADEVARYSIAATGVLTLSALLESFSAALKPAVSALDARDEVGAIRELSLATQKFSLLLIIPSTAFLVLMGRAFLRLWTGKEQVDVVLAMALLAVGQAFRLSQQSNFLVLVGKGEHRFFGLSVLMVGGLTIIGTAVAVGILNWGIVGAAAASALAWVLIAGTRIPAHVNAQLGIDSAERQRRVWWPVVAGCAPGVLLMAAWQHWHPLQSWSEILAVVLIVAVTTAVSAWRFSLEPVEQRRLLSLFGTLRVVDE
jgi:O-antigen/teichoic acid export membrane protein